MKGVIGIYSNQDVTRKGLYLLYGVQHRGQEGAGLSAASDHSLRTWSGRGLVSNVFDKRFNSWIHPDDNITIGCASGEGKKNNIFPPLEVETDSYKFSIALDGFFLGEDTGREEEILSEILEGYLKSMGIEEAITNFMREHKDAYYSLVMAYLDKEKNESMLIAARDSRGVRPLYITSNDNELLIASESAAIEVLENRDMYFNERRDLTPGKLLIKRRNGVKEKQILKPQPAHCAFEWVYFGRPDSVIEGKTVHIVRKKLGHTLVETHDLRERFDRESNKREIVIIPVPDSGRSVCTGVSEGLNLSSDEGVIKNAYMGRTYIIEDPKFRKIASDLKHNIVREVIKDKKVLITDDSIVRGTVSESIAKNLLRAGAAEVEFLVSYAPIFYPCYSDPADKNLAAASYKGKGLEEIGNSVASKLPSINKVLYNSPKNIVKAIGLQKKQICTYCITGKNPFKQR